MQIRNDVNFTGIYRLPLNEKNLREFREHIVPMYTYIRHEPIVTFPGNNPAKFIGDIMLNRIAELAGGSKEWLKMNAQNHNLDVSDMTSSVLHVISSRKDVERFNEFIKNTAAKKMSFFEKLKIALNPNKNIREDLPLHLKFVQATLNNMKTRDKEFAEFAGTDLVEVKTPQELLKRMLTEK